MEKIDREVMGFAREGFNTEGQAEWLWYDNNANPNAPVGFSRWASVAGQVPYIRADLALKLNEVAPKDNQDAVDLAHMCMKVCAKHAVIRLKDDDMWESAIADPAYFEIYSNLCEAMRTSVPDDAKEIAQDVFYCRNESDYGGVPEAAALISAWSAKREDAALKRALESWHNIMALVPMGQEDAVAGASTYNWMRRARDHFVSFLNPVSEIAHKKEDRKNES